MFCCIIHTDQSVCSDIELRDIECKDIERRDIEYRDIEYRDIECRDIECRDIECRDIDAGGLNSYAGGVSMDTRDVILSAAVREFSQTGYHKTSMDKIAITAELSKGALYYFFKNKSELFLTVVREGLDMLDRRTDRIRNSDLSHSEAIYRIVEAYVGVCLDHPQLALIILNENMHNLDPELAERVRELVRVSVDHLVFLISEGMRYGYIRKYNAELISMLFIGMLRSISAGVNDLRPVPGRSEVIDAMYGMVVNGICTGGRE